MSFPSDIEIAQINEHDNMKNINEIATKIGLTPDDIEPYGHYKAKFSGRSINKTMEKDDGKLILIPMMCIFPHNRSLFQQRCVSRSHEPANFLAQIVHPAFVSMSNYGMG